MLARVNLSIIIAVLPSIYIFMHKRDISYFSSNTSLTRRVAYIHNMCTSRQPCGSQTAITSSNVRLIQRDCTSIPSWPILVATSALRKGVLPSIDQSTITARVLGCPHPATSLASHSCTDKSSPLLHMVSFCVQMSLPCQEYPHIWFSRSHEKPSYPVCVDPQRALMHALFGKGYLARASASAVTYKYNKLFI